MKKQGKIQIKQRDINILKSMQGEINLNTRAVKNKKKYSRKVKYKHKVFE